MFRLSRENKAFRSLSFTYNVAQQGHKATTNEKKAPRAPAGGGGGCCCCCCCCCCWGSLRCGCGSSGGASSSQTDPHPADGCLHQPPHWTLWDGVKTIVRRVGTQESVPMTGAYRLVRELNIAIKTKIHLIICKLIREEIISLLPQRTQPLPHMDGAPVRVSADAPSVPPWDKKPAD